MLKIEEIKKIDKKHIALMAYMIHHFWCIIQLKLPSVAFLHLFVAGLCLLIAGAKWYDIKY